MDNEYYKYVSFETAKIILSDLTIRFSKPCSFNDIYDCEAPYKVTNFSKNDFLTLYNNVFSSCDDDAKNKLKIGYNKVRNGTYSDEEIEYAAKTIIDNCRNFINETQRVLCLSKRKDSILMWSHYAQNHTGIVIGFDKNYKFLKKSKEVKYSKQPQNIDGFILKDFNNEDGLKSEFEKLLLTKHQDWQYENEVRSFFSTELLYQYFYDLKIQSIDNRYKNCTKQLKNNENFIDLPIAKESIKSIYLGVNINIIAIDEIIALAKMINNSIKIFQAKKSKGFLQIIF